MVGNRAGGTLSWHGLVWSKQARLGWEEPSVGVNQQKCDLAHSSRRLVTYKGLSKEVNILKLMTAKLLIITKGRNKYRGGKARINYVVLELNWRYWYELMAYNIYG